MLSVELANQGKKVRFENDGGQPQERTSGDEQAKKIPEELLQAAGKKKNLPKNVLNRDFESGKPLKKQVQPES